MAVILNENQYKYTGRGPLDPKALVKTYDNLLDETTWTVDDRLIAYNYMITAVWLNKADTTKNGVYFLYDPTVTTALGKPNVTDERNWHKLADLDDISGLSDKVNAVQTNLDAIYKPASEGLAATGILAQEITRVIIAEEANTNAIATIIGNDTNKTIRDIASEEITKFIQNNPNSTEALASEINTLKSIVDTGGLTISDYVANMLANTAFPKPSGEIDIADDGTLSIKELNVNKLVQTDEDTLLLGCGSATE